MNANELMLGNIVLNEYGKRQKVASIDEGSGIVSFSEAEDTFFCNYISQIKPVELTLEFIEKHGFVRQKEDFTPDVKLYEKKVDGRFVDVSLWENGRWYVRVDDCNRESLGGCFVKHVHEFQNICTLCGIEKVFKS